MITLYLKDNCAYTPMVIEMLNRLHVPFIEKNLNTLGVVEELKEKGGKSQVPYIFDDATQMGIYESQAIIGYLEEHYGQGGGVSFL